MVEHLPSKCEALSSNPMPQKKKPSLARHWWLTPIILAIQKAEIRRIEVQSQRQVIVCETLSQKNNNKITEKGLVE
jgi:hypothetical protein